jgi:hypothetical protein
MNQLQAIAATVSTVEPRNVLAGRLQMPAAGRLTTARTTFSGASRRARSQGLCLALTKTRNLNWPKTGQKPNGPRADFTQMAILSRSRAHSSAGERSLHTREVPGSIPGAPTEEQAANGSLQWAPPFADRAAEASTSSCNSAATAYRRNQMAQARAAVQVCSNAEVMGVTFFDFFHHQTGVAPNEIELHPILALKCLTP